MQMRVPAQGHLARPHGVDLWLLYFELSQTKKGGGGVDCRLQIRPKFVSD